jgi:rubrerythrin
MNFTNRLDVLLSEKVIHAVPKANPDVGICETIRMLEADLADEIKAISAYDAHVKAVRDKKVKEQLAEIRDEEKHHAAELKVMISRLQEEGEKND